MLIFPDSPLEAILFDKNFDISQIEMELCRSTESISMSMSQLLEVKEQKLTKCTKYNATYSFYHLTEIV